MTLNEFVNNVNKCNLSKEAISQGLKDIIDIVGPDEFLIILNDCGILEDLLINEEDDMYGTEGMRLL